MGPRGVGGGCGFEMVWLGEVSKKGGGGGRRVRGCLSDTLDTR